MQKKHVTLKEIIMSQKDIQYIDLCMRYFTELVSLKELELGFGLIPLFQ